MIRANSARVEGKELEMASRTALEKMQNAGIDDVRRTAFENAGIDFLPAKDKDLHFSDRQVFKAVKRTADDEEVEGAMVVDMWGMIPPVMR